MSKIDSNENIPEEKKRIKVIVWVIVYDKYE